MTADKILLVFPVGERGGAEAVFCTLAEHLDRRRFQPMAWFLRSGSLIQEMRAKEIEVFLTPITRLRDLANVWRTVGAGRRFILREGIRLVVSSLGYGHVYGGLAAWRAGVKAIWWQHGMASAGNWVDRLAARIPAKLIIASSHVAAHRHARVYGTNGARLEVIHPGVDLVPDRLLSAAHRRTVSEKLGLHPRATVIACVGRFQPGKGQAVLIRAAAEVCRRHPNVVFLLVGSEMYGLNRGYERELKRLVAALNLQRNVLFTGFCRDVATIWAAVDVVVHPATAPESFGVSIIEAMAAGKPVVATDVGGPGEIIIHGESGWLVEPDDERALSRAILMLVENPPLRQRLGRAARQRVVAHFSRRAMVQRAEAAFRSVLEP